MSWQVRMAPWAQPAVPDPAALGALLRAALSSPERVLRDDQRSRVLLVRPPLDTPTDLLKQSPGPWVLKRPLWRDGRLWNRLVSWLGPGEMSRAFAGGLLLLSTGLQTPRPLLVMERRRAGLLVESWLVYEFVEGRPLTEEDWPALVSALRLLHASGLRHGDPHLANWLIRTDGSLCALDPGPRPLRPLLADDAHDFVLLRNCRPDILPLLPGVGTWRWRVAEARNAWTQAWRRGKRWLRGLGKR
jgi:heptose II phosphotransferase